MSDSVVKLRIDSKEYDANIKRAGQALTDYFNKVKEGGGTLMHLDEGVMEAVKAMGSLGTQANNIKGGLRELTQATTDMTAAYRALTDEEKASPLGQAMQKSIAQMTERAGDMRDAMADVQASINNAASDTRLFDQLAGGATLLTSSLQTAQGAARLFGVEMGDSVKVLADLQAAMAVTSGLQQLQNLLQKQSALMQGVNALQKEFNLLAAANPYALLATAVAAVAGAYMLYQKNASEAEKAQKSLNAELDNTQNQLSQIDKDTDFSVGIAEAAGKSWKAIHELRLEAARTKLQLADMNYDKLADSGNASAEQMKQAAEMQQKAWDNVMKVLNEGTIHEVQMRNGKGKRGGKGSKGTTVEQTEEQMNNSQIEKLTNEYIKATDERRQAIEKEIATLQKRNEEIQKLKDMALGKSFDGGTLNGEVVVTGSKMASINKTFRDAPVNFDSINAYISGIKDRLKDANLGDELYNKMTEKLKDATTVSTLLQEMMERGLAGADLESAAQALKEKLLSPEGIDQTAIQSFIDELNKQIEEAGGVGLKLNADTGEVTDDKRNGKEEGDGFMRFHEDTNKLTSGLSQVSSGLKSIGIDVPKEIDQMIGVINGVSQVISGVGTIISLVSTSAMTANTIALGALTSAVWASVATKFVPFFSGGGVVPAFAQGGLIGRAALGMKIPGNSMSGDNLRLPVDGGLGMIGVNSGELILNRAQQGNLASQLEGGGIAQGTPEARISGEDIWITLNNYTQRSGYGEIVTSK